MTPPTRVGSHAATDATSRARDAGPSALTPVRSVPVERVGGVRHMRDRPGPSDRIEGVHGIPTGRQKYGHPGGRPAVDAHVAVQEDLGARILQCHRGPCGDGVEPVIPRLTSSASTWPLAEPRRLRREARDPSVDWISAELWPGVWNREERRLTTPPPADAMPTSISWFLSWAKMRWPLTRTSLSPSRARTPRTTARAGYERRLGRQQHRHDVDRPRNRGHRLAPSV